MPAPVETEAAVWDWSLDVQLVQGERIETVLQPLEKLVHEVCAEEEV